jgi:hypothetical protein
MIQFFCDVCCDDQEVIIEPMKSDALNGPKHYWGDILCKKCKFVISTVKATEPGIYKLVKIGELDDAPTT